MIFITMITLALAACPDHKSWVTTLKGLQDELPCAFAGQLDLGNEKTAFYFYSRAIKEDTDPAPLTFWFSGGPGGSGLGGLFFEIGSLWVTKEKDEFKLYNT